MRQHRLRERCRVAARRSSRALDGNCHRLGCLLSVLLPIETSEGETSIPSRRNEDPSVAEAAQYMKSPTSCCTRMLAALWVSFKPIFRVIRWFDGTLVLRLINTECFVLRHDV